MRYIHIKVRNNEKFYGILFSLFLIFPLAVFAQHTKKTQIKQIDAYSRKLNFYIKKNEKAGQVFGDISATQKSKWQKFKTDTARENFDTGDNLNQNAIVWREKGKIVAAVFTYQSPSRDWAHYVSNYYRPDGSVAKVEAALNTFYGNVTVKRNFYFDKNGKLIHKTIRFLDLNTQKSRKPNDNFLDNEVIYYKKVSNLPFAALVE